MIAWQARVCTPACGTGTSANAAASSPPGQGIPGHLERSQGAIDLPVVVPQAGQVHQGRPDIGLVGPRSRQVRLRDSDLATVGTRRAGSLVRLVAVQAQVLDARTHVSDVVGVDLGGIVAVIPGVFGRESPGTRTSPLQEPVSGAACRR